MIFGNACFLCTRVKGSFFLHACMHYDGWFLRLVIILHAAYTTKVRIHSHWIKMKDGFTAHSFSQDRDREALPPTRRNGIFGNAYVSLRKKTCRPSQPANVCFLFNFSPFSCYTNFVFCAFTPLFALWAFWGWVDRVTF